MNVLPLLALLMHAHDYEPSNPPPSEPASAPVAETAPAVAPGSEPDWHERLVKAFDHGPTLSLADGWFNTAVGMNLRPRFDLPVKSQWPILSLSMVRPQFRASIWQDRVKLFVQPEFATATPSILDAEVTIKPWSWLGVRAGRFITPYSRVFVTAVPRWKFADTSASDVFFRSDRDIGGSLVGKASVFDYEAGVFSGSHTMPSANDSTRFLTVARLNAQLFGNVPYDENVCTLKGCETSLSLGVNGYYQRYQARATTLDPMTGMSTLTAQGDEQRTSSAADFAFGTGRFQAQGELFYRAVHPAGRLPRQDQLGGYLHAGYGVVPEWFELSARADFLAPNLAATSNRLFSLDLQAVTYVFHDHTKLWLQYSLHSAEAKATLPATWIAGSGLISHQFLVEMQFWL